MTCEQEVRGHVFGPIGWRDCPGMEHGRASAGVDINTHFGGVLQQALGVFEGFHEEAGYSYVIRVGIVFGVGHGLRGPFSVATVYLCLLI